MLYLAREFMKARTWILVAIIALLGWLSGYDVR